MKILLDVRFQDGAGGIDRASDFDWDQAANQVFETYDRVLARQDADQGERPLA